ncbi:hypothetical protein [Labrys monachus]|uniref:Cell division septation protein DedD n=1 Tax=Labrys monachus TaxID=217067 RepID=A0ABU0FBM3_9HYPH|nr:hypothetical protein [Labrys monachus]MDQ0391727.1 cell division septation protein DedD [Labrys monachus]
MTKSSDIPARPSDIPVPTAPPPGHARERLEHLYRAIGIPAVAAAAAQVSREERPVDKPRHELPACLRDDDVAA